jgi:hypothetical protein
MVAQSPAGSGFLRFTARVTIRSQICQRLNRLRKKRPTLFVIPNEARNLSFFSWAETEERFLASFGMTKLATFSVACEAGRMLRALRDG